MKFNLFEETNKKLNEATVIIFSTNDDDIFPTFESENKMIYLIWNNGKQFLKDGILILKEELNDGMINLKILHELPKFIEFIYSQIKLHDLNIKTE